MKALLLVLAIAPILMVAANDIKRSRLLRHGPQGRHVARTGAQEMRGRIGD